MLVDKAFDKAMFSALMLESVYDFKATLALVILVVKAVFKALMLESV